MVCMNVSRHFLDESSLSLDLDYQKPILFSHLPSSVEIMIQCQGPQSGLEAAGDDTYTEEIRDEKKPDSGSVCRRRLLVAL